jgi:hypothetical protein
VKKTRSVLKTNCRDSLDHMQPMWFRSFRSKLSRVMDYRRGLREIQGEFLGIFSETRTGVKDGARYACARYHFASRGVIGRRGAKVAERANSGQSIKPMALFAPRFRLFPAQSATLDADYANVLAASDVKGTGPGHG